MNFQDLKTVENADFYLDVAFRRAKTKLDLLREKKRTGTRVEKSRHMESVRIEVVKDTLVNSLQAILVAYPSIDGLPEFYRELIRLTLDYPDLKKSLGALNWAVQQIEKFWRIYTSKINKSGDLPAINSYRREFYGRISSFMKQINSSLLFLEAARKVMKAYPSIKTGCFTVCLYGFPNVGKTTLLSKLTGSTPNIQNYAFTTKSINLGYAKMKIDGKLQKVQFMDVPGVLDRSTMNPIEEQAHLALRLVSNVIIYVFDLTESYPLKDQKKLFGTLKKMKQPLVVYFSKSDLIPKKDIDAFKQSFDVEGSTTPADLKKKIILTLSELELDQQKTE